MSDDTPAARMISKRSVWSGMLLVLLLVGVFTVTALTPGTTSAYTGRITNNTDTAATAANFTCAGAYGVDKANALFQYPLTESANSATALDISGKTANGSYQGSMATSSTTPMACPRDAGSSYVLNGSTSYLSTPTQVTSPATFSLETWFKTTVPAGKLIGFDSNQTGASGQFDRQIYLTPTGQIIFGVYSGATHTIITPGSYANGTWHQVVATFSAAAGMTLYLDGVNVASNATYNAAEPHAGYWRIGYGSLSGWPTPGTNNFYTGALRFTAIYTTALTQAQVTNHYVAGH